MKKMIQYGLMGILLCLTSGYFFQNTSLLEHKRIFAQCRLNEVERAKNTPAENNELIKKRDLLVREIAMAEAGIQKIKERRLVLFGGIQAVFVICVLWGIREGLANHKKGTPTNTILKGNGWLLLNVMLYVMSWFCIFFHAIC
jgi:hypothetical protein